MASDESSDNKSCETNDGAYGCPIACGFARMIKSPAVWIPLLVLLIGSAAIRMTDADRRLAARYYSETPHGVANSSDQYPAHWPLRQSQPWKALYHWGYYPAWAVGIGGLVFFVASFFVTSLRPLRDPGFFCFLALALGPGLLVNGIFKPYWGRPRPSQIVEFGGIAQFKPVGEMGEAESEGASFPSGHASSAFYLITPAFIFFRTRPRMAVGIFAFGVFYGCLMGAARIVGGGHFLSDVLWAFGFVYYADLALAAWIFPAKKSCRE